MRRTRDQRADPGAGRQQETGAATPEPLPGAARLVLGVQQSAGNAAAGRLIRGRSRRPAVLRYQAGERGHGGIEEEGLRAAGFGGDMRSGEIGKVYLGNWMRDWSQVPPGPAKSLVHDQVVGILSILSMGEFGTPVTSAELGGYLPSEHMDNPLGGGSPESPGTTPADLAAAAQAEAQLSPEQREVVRRERTPAFQAMIAAASAASGLPDYIERGKEHAKEKLTAAVLETNGRDRAMLDLGTPCTRSRTTSRTRTSRRSRCRSSRRRATSPPGRSSPRRGAAASTPRPPEAPTPSGGPGSSQAPTAPSRTRPTRSSA